MVLVVPVAVKVFYPIYYKLDVTSCYEYLGMRFDKRIRTFGAVLYILQVRSFSLSLSSMYRKLRLPVLTTLKASRQEVFDTEVPEYSSGLE